MRPQLLTLQKIQPLLLPSQVWMMTMMMTNTVMITTKMMMMMSQVWTSVILPDFSESLLKTLQIITISLNPTSSPSPNPLISPPEEFTTSPSATSPSLNPSTHSSLNQLTPTSPSVTIQPAITSNSKHLSYYLFFVVQLNAQGCLNKIKE